MKKKISGILVMGLLLLMPNIVKADEYLKSISIGTIDNFNLDRASKVYNLTYYDATGDYATIKVEPQDGVTVEGDGKVAIEEGQNQFVIKATKGDSTQTYTINLNVVRQDISSGNNPATGDFLPISIAFICAGAVGGYLVIKKKNKFYRV